MRWSFTATGICSDTDDGDGCQSAREIGQNRVFTIASPISMPAAADLQTLQTDVSSWPVPALAILRGTVLGAADFTFYYPPPKMIRDGKPVVAPVPDQWRSLRMEDQFDALLYLGPPSSITMAQMSPTLCSDRRYMEMRLRRMALSPVPGQIDRLKQVLCRDSPKVASSNPQRSCHREAYSPEEAPR